MRVNNRIIVIDDSQDIRDDYKNILCPEEKSSDLLEIEKFLADSESDTQKEEANRNFFREPVSVEKYDVGFASQGEDGFKMVRRSIEENSPFALAFIDMRMPPGWNGLETAKKIREIDKDIEIVIVTAYADISQAKLNQEIQPEEKLLYLKKPFSGEEINQLAINLCHKYYLDKKNQLYSESLKNLILSMRQLKGNVYTDYLEILKNILHHVLNYVGAENGLLAIIQNKSIERIIAVGNFDETTEKDIMKEIDVIKRKKNEHTYLQDEQYLIFPISTSDPEGKELYIFAVKANEDLKANERIMTLLVDTIQDIFANIVYQKKYIESQRLASIGLAAGKIIHDLKNPLSAITGMADMIRYESKKTESENIKQNISEYCDLILMASDAMINNIQSILSYSSGKLEINLGFCTIADVINGFYSENRFVIDKQKIIYETKVSSQKILKIDYNQMKRVISNLFSNSIQAFENNKITDRHFSIEAYDMPDSVVLLVKDNGLGIPANIVDKIFEPFITSGKHKGTGLGLAIVKQLINNHNGKISLETNQEGTTFKITLPEASLHK